MYINNQIKSSWLYIVLQQSFSPIETPSLLAGDGCKVEAYNQDLTFFEKERIVIVPHLL
jgi:hypothetical protein